MSVNWAEQLAAQIEGIAQILPEGTNTAVVQGKLLEQAGDDAQEIVTDTRYLSGMITGLVAGMNLLSMPSITAAVPCDAEDCDIDVHYWADAQQAISTLALNMQAAIELHTGFKELDELAG